MAVVIPNYDFDGYPDGGKRVSFRKGIEATVSDDYAKLLIAKKAAIRAKKSPDSE